MKRTFRDSFIAWVVGLALAAVGILLWIYPIPWLFPFGQNVIAGIAIFVGVLTMIFGDPKGLV